MNKVFAGFLFINWRTWGLLVLVATIVATGSMASAQNKANKKTLPDWSGVWAPLPSNFTGGSGGSTGAVTAQGTKALNPFFYTPAYQPMFEKNMKGELGEGKAYDPTTNCEPPGMPRLLLIPYPIEFVVMPEKVLVVHEYHSQIRRIYTDGRKHPPADELAESYNGHSIGHWEGDTLVVDTVGLKSTTLLDRANVHSDALQMTERIRRIGDRMEDKITLTDAKAFTQPWTTTYTWERKTGEDWDLKEYVCQENNRNPADPETGRSSFLPAR